jgi:transmembrane sensor
MDKTNIRLKELLHLHLAQRATAIETAELWDYVDDPIYAEEVKQLLSDTFLAQTDEHTLTDLEREKVLQNIFEAKQREKPKTIRLLPRIVVAAAAVAAITLSIWIYTSRHPDPTRHPELVSASQDIAPGKNTATLTFANGKTINLSDNKTGVVINNDKLAYNDGSIINDPSLAKAISPGGRESNTQMLTAATPRGGTYIVTLPDGTKVWLNADSKLEFPSKFGKNEQRIVRLSGEGYFEVSKDKAHPFVVQTDKQEVTVLGTHFNINAYKDENGVRTTLLEGSVSVTPLSAMGRDVARDREVKGKSSTLSGLHPSLPEGENRVILKPNQQSVLTASNRIVVASVDVNEAVAWKNGKFVFNDEPLENIMRKVARWYDVDIEYRDIDPKKTFWGSISRFENVSKVIEKLELTGGVDFKIEGKKIVVSNGKK